MFCLSFSSFPFPSLFGFVLWGFFGGWVVGRVSGSGGGRGWLEGKTGEGWEWKTDGGGARRGGEVERDDDDGG